MPSFSSIFTSLTGAGIFYEKSARHSSYVFNQESQALYRNQPRFSFEYYVGINLNNVGTASSFIAEFFNSPNWEQVTPLVKKVDMPSMKIQTEHLNQYNRKRISQTKVDFEPIKMVFHDVADGKTLKFWEMYYRYYFGDGSEPGKNTAKQVSGPTGPMSVSSLVSNITPKINPNIAKLFGANVPGSKKPTNTDGQKCVIDNIVEDKLDNHSFGFNLPTVNNVRSLIQSIDIYQVHAGRFNQVTLVNPRISAFQHDVLDYSESGKTLELTFTLEYEYAYYTVQNMRLGGGESNNNSSMEPFEHGEFLELPALAFNARLMDFVESNNPLLNSDNPILQRVGRNVQSKLGSVTGAVLSDKVVRRVSASALDGLANISPRPYYPTSPADISTRPFTQTAGKVSSAYQDISRIIK